MHDIFLRVIENNPKEAWQIPVFVRLNTRLLPDQGKDAILVLKFYDEQGLAGEVIFRWGAVLEEVHDPACGSYVYTDAEIEDIQHPADMSEDEFTKAVIRAMRDCDWKVQAYDIELDDPDSHVVFQQWIAKTLNVFHPGR